VKLSKTISSPAPVVQLQGSQKISAARAQKILEENGMKVSLIQAARIKDFLYTLAKLTARS
jgi:hypothetical protein